VSAVAAALPAATRTAPLAVLAASRSLPFHGIGGMQAIAWDVLAGLARRGHRVTVLTTAIRGRSGAFQSDGVAVVPLEDTLPERYSGGWWRASRRYVERQVAGDVDVVLSVSSAAAGLLPLKGSRLAVPFIFQVHGSSWAEARAKWQSTRPLDWVKSARNVCWLAKDAVLYRGFDRLVFVGDALRKQFEAPPLRWMTRGIERTTIANGIDTRRFRCNAGRSASVRARFGFAPGERVLVFAARLHAQKGAAEALRALAVLRARDSSYKLLVVGDGAESGALRRLAGELGCEGAVAFAGAVHRDAVPELLAAGNAFVFPALGGRRECGVTLNVLEALSVGLPCVCGESLRDVFGPLDGISYAPPRDARALAAALDEAALRSSPDATLLPAEYSLERCIDAYESLLSGSSMRGAATSRSVQD
jgi:glycosyltransferase involved in cell wall biosynthesis